VSQPYRYPLERVQATLSQLFSLEFLQEARIKRPRQEVLDRHFFALSPQIRQDDLGVLSELPDDLPAIAARRRQLLSVSDDNQTGKVPLAFRQGFPDRHALSAHRQTVAGAFDIATREYHSCLRLQRGPHEEV